jgi:hypothetical protein
MVARATKGENDDVNQQPRQPIGSASRRSALNRRLRIAFIAGAEERSRETMGRGLTDEELGRVIERYPGDVKDRSRANPARPRVADSRDAPG